MRLNAIFVPTWSKHETHFTIRVELPPPRAYQDLKGNGNDMSGWAEQLVKLPFLHSAQTSVQGAVLISGQRQSNALSLHNYISKQEIYQETQKVTADNP